MCMIDCLIIGHNEGNFKEYQNTLQKMGETSPTYRDLGLNYIMIDGNPSTLGDIWNRVCVQLPIKGATLSFFDTFSATIAYLGSFLDRNGFTSDFIHSFRGDRRRLADDLKQNRFRCVAITTTYYVQPQPLIEVVEFVRRHSTDVLIIVGGPFVTTHVRSIEDPQTLEHLFFVIGADIYVNSSQGESALVEIIRSMRNLESFDHIPNLFVRSDNVFKRTDCQPERNSLADTPINWPLFSDQIREYVNVRTAISCPFTCAFCGFPEVAGRYETMPVDISGQMLDSLHRMSNLKGIKFVDDTLNVPIKRYRAFLEMLLAQHFRIPWFANYRCQYADEESVSMMKESGCEAVFLGIESGSDTILRNMDKNATVDQYLNGISLLRDAGIMTFGSFIIGYPGETDETVRETINFLQRSGLDYFRPNLWYCERITPIWRRRTDFGLSGENFEWRHNTMDVHEACGWVEEIVACVDSPMYVPMYDFDIESIWHLEHQGFRREQVRAMLELFRHSLRRKLRGMDSDITWAKLGLSVANCFSEHSSESGHSLYRGPMAIPFRFE